MASKGTLLVLYLMLQIAGQVLGEDLVLVLGQQARMIAGDNTWGTPLPYDKLAVRYRRWRNTVRKATWSYD
jgi:hypothetical protein